STGPSVKEPVTTEPTTGQTQEPSRTESEGTETKATKPEATGSTGTREVSKPVPADTTTEQPNEATSTVAEDLKPSETDVLRERAKAASDAAVYNRNDIRDLKRQIENLEKGPARPGRADDLKDLEEDLKAVQNQQ